MILDSRNRQRVAVCVCVIGENIDITDHAADHGNGTVCIRHGRCKKARPFGGTYGGDVNNTYACFKVPVAAQVGRACHIVRSRNIGARDPAKDHGGLKPLITCCEIAAIDKDIAVCGQRLADNCQLIQIFCLHCSAVQRGATEAEATLRTVRKDMDRIDIGAAIKNVGDLLNAIA